MNKTEERRKNYFIKKEFQRSFILRFCGLLILAALISAVMLLLFSRGTLTTAFINSRLSIVSTATYILPALISSSLTSIVLVSIATAAVIIYLSHKIAGPLYKVETIAEKIGQGDLTQRIRLRSGDEMKKLAGCFNEMTDNLNQVLKQVRQQARNLSLSIDKLASKSEQELSSGQMRRALNELIRQKSDLDQALGRFKL